MYLFEGGNKLAFAVLADKSSRKNLRAPVILDTATVKLV
jgi:hypothetical protein